MKDIIIIGAGGVGKEVTFIIEQINKVKQTWNILGIIDDNEKLHGSTINGYKVLGGLSYLNKYLNNEKKPELIVAMADYNIKKGIVNKLNNKFNFATIIHPEVEIHNTIKVGKGSIIYNGVIMTTNITIGNHVLISPKCGIGHDSILKDYVSLLWNVNISGKDIIEEGVFVGSAATIIQGKRIGQGAIIGAGAVVIKDISNNTTNVGVPSKTIKIMKSIQKVV